MTLDNTYLKRLVKEQEETNRLLRMIALKHEHRWVGPDKDGPIRCKLCKEVY